MASAALLNGLASHTFDLDDTHLKTIIHPAGPVAPAGLALCEHLNLGGRAMLDALMRGIEVSCRFGNAIDPDRDGRELHFFVEHEIGSFERPMSDAQLRAKFEAQSEPVPGAAKTTSAWALSMGIAQCTDLCEFIAAVTL